MEERLSSPNQAYWAWGQIMNHLGPNPNPIFLPCDEFLSSSPASLLPPTPVAVVKRELTPLDRLTEILVSRRQSQSGGTTSVSPRMIIRQQLTNLFQSLIPQPQTIILVLAMAGVFGFLVSPLH